MDRTYRIRVQKQVNLDSVDNVVKNEAVTFIKMDIEGLELKALQGSAKTITKNKPKLAICVYHKPEDILSIPLYLASLVPEYGFYVRHHSITHCETVLYATV